MLIWRAKHLAKIVHPQRLEHLFEPFLEPVPLQAVEPGEELDEFPGRHAIVNGRVRGEETDVLANFFRLREDVVAGDSGDAARGLEDGAQDAHRGRLAGAVGAEQAENFAGLGVERDVIDGQDLTAAQIAKRLGEVFEMDHAAVLFISAPQGGPGSANAKPQAAFLCPLWLLQTRLHIKSSPECTRNERNLPENP